MFTHSKYESILYGKLQAFKKGRGKILKKGRTKYLMWVIVGIVMCFVEMILLSVISIHEIFKETVVLFAISALLFRAVNHSGKGKPFYFFKCVVCMWIGRIVIDVMLYHDGGREIASWVIFWQVMVTILLFCMKLIQMVYDRIPEKKTYFGYILIGTALAFNVSYIVRMYSSFPQSEGLLWGMVQDVYVLEHGAALLIAVAVTVYWYQKRYKVSMKTNEIAGSTYLRNAINMTAVSFLLFVYPLYLLFLSE